MKTKEYPVVLEEHGERVVIRKVRDHDTEAFRIEYYVAGKRRMKTRADEREAHPEAGRISVSSGFVSSGYATPSKSQSWVRKSA